MYAVSTQAHKPRLQLQILYLANIYKAMRTVVRDKTISFRAISKSIIGTLNLFSNSNPAFRMPVCTVMTSCPPLKRFRGHPRYSDFGLSLAEAVAPGLCSATSCHRPTLLDVKEVPSPIDTPSLVDIACHRACFHLS
jgi:hypothetical protein